MVEFRTDAIDTDGGWSYLFPQEDLVASWCLLTRRNPTFTQKGGITMTVLDLISVLSFGLTCFSIGYAIGFNRPIKNDRHGLTNCAINFRKVMKGQPPVGAPFMLL